MQEDLVDEIGLSIRLGRKETLNVGRGLGIEVGVVKLGSKHSESFAKVGSRLRHERCGEVKD